MSYQTIKLHLATHSYPIYVGPALLKNRALFSQHIQGKQVMIVTQKEVADFYLKDLLQTLADYQCAVTYLPSGERHKNFSAWRRIIDHLVAQQHERSTTVLALGGGIVGDVAGFAAACYLRGVHYIQIPTTLIAQVDSAIGGKTGFNHAAGKNLIGAFYHPQAVFADTATLVTLPRREFIAGLAEVIKYGLIQDKLFFSWLEAQLPAVLQAESETLLQAIATAARIKARVVALDEREQTGIRSILNFGHTVGHALEALYGYRELLHGEAVAIGMKVAAGLSMDLGWLTQIEQARIDALLCATTLPLQLKRRFNPQKFLSYLKRDKKIHNGSLRLVLLKGLGEPVLTEAVSEAFLMKTISHRFDGRSF